mgnify:CR=1 FL=1
MTAKKKEIKIKVGSVIKDKEHPEVIGVVIELGSGDWLREQGSYRVYPLSDNWSYKGNPLGWYDSQYIESLFEVVA